MQIKFRFALLTALIASTFSQTTEENKECSNPFGVSTCKEMVKKNFETYEIGTLMLSPLTQHADFGGLATVALHDEKEVHKLCDHSSDIDQCVANEGLRERCPLVPFVKEVDNVLLYLCGNKDRTQEFINAIGCMRSMEQYPERRQRIRSCINQASTKIEEQKKEAANLRASAEICRSYQQFIDCVRQDFIDQCGEKMFRTTADLVGRTVQAYSDKCYGVGSASRLHFNGILLHSIFLLCTTVFLY